MSDAPSPLTPTAKEKANRTTSRKDEPFLQSFMILIMRLPA